jgi:hypothetical protein
VLGRDRQDDLSIVRDPGDACSDAVDQHLSLRQLPQPFDPRGFQLSDPLA